MLYIYHDDTMSGYQETLLLIWINFIPSMNLINKVKTEIIHPFPNFNGCAMVEPLNFENG